MKIKNKKNKKPPHPADAAGPWGMFGSLLLVGETKIWPSPDNCKNLHGSSVQVWPAFKNVSMP